MTKEFSAFPRARGRPVSGKDDDATSMEARIAFAERAPKLTHVIDSIATASDGRADYAVIGKKDDPAFLCRLYVDETPFANFLMERNGHITSIIIPEVRNHKRFGNDDPADNDAKATHHLKGSCDKLHIMQHARRMFAATDRAISHKEAVRQHRTHRTPHPKSHPK